MKLFLIRHGQTYANADRIYAGQSDVALTEAGKAQARAIAPILEGIPFDRVYSSDLRRAIHTQQLALPGYTAIPLPLIREYAIGSLTGMGIDEANEKCPPIGSDFTPFGGENTEMVVARVRAFLAQLEQDPAERIAAFTHNGFMKCMLRLVLNNANPINAENGNCNIAVFEYKDQTWRLLSWNYGNKFF